MVTDQLGTIHFHERIRGADSNIVQNLGNNLGYHRLTGSGISQQYKVVSFPGIDGSLSPIY